MNKAARLAILALTTGLSLFARAQGASDRRVVVFQQEGFPTVASEPVSKEVLTSALGSSLRFADIAQLRSGEGLRQVSLLVLPYGSSVPAEAWPAIVSYIDAGGNLLLLGGQPLRVPVLGERAGGFTQEAPQDSYSRQLDFRHTYEVPGEVAATHFAWRDGYTFLPKLEIAPKAVYAVEGRLNGLGYLDAADGTHVAAPVIVADRLHGSGAGARIVALPFTPAKGFWESASGTRLISACAEYAESGAADLSLEVQYAALHPNEIPEITAHLRGGRQGSADRGAEAAGQLHVELLAGETVLDSATVPLRAAGSAPVPFGKALPEGVYTLRATWQASGAKRPQEFARNGFVVETLASLESGSALGTRGDFLTLGGQPFFPVGTNYFTTEENGWDFSGPRNEAVWEQDFADMERHGVNFVRTGVWGGYGKFIEPLTGGVNERFLRNLEGFLAAAHRHHIAVNFTFFAFSPHINDVRPQQGGDPEAKPTPPNPYLNQGAVRGEQGYVLSVVDRFGRVPWLCYDLINEPSFSNPRLIFHGNVPNDDPVEKGEWHQWLKRRYKTLDALADAWRVTPGDLEAFEAIPLPSVKDLTYDRYGNPNEVRAFDYNLFAQEMFSGWVHGMVQAIRGDGSEQLIDVGQDEGGVTNRVLNQFYATAGVSFTTNHTYWDDDALLWDSIAAKRPGRPNITGETGYQPAWDPDGSWRYDELTGTALEERKWALGFAAGSSGALQWDWAREVDFGIERSDGSAKVWEGLMRDLSGFARDAAPYATGMRLPEVAIVLPEALQLSVFNSAALQAQQRAVRVLYQYNRVEAYAVGSFATDALGSPRLILLPSTYGLNDRAWADIEARVRAGAVLLVSGPFSGDEHLHPTDRALQMGLNYTVGDLQQRDELLRTSFGDLPLEYPGLETTVLDRARLPGDASWAERSLGKGTVLFSALPLELNSRLDSIAAVYAHALKLASVDRTYTTTVKDEGVLICPTRLPNATLYVLTSETGTTAVQFRDERSGASFSGALPAGRAALLLVGTDGKLLASYHWASSTEATSRKAK